MARADPHLVLAAPEQRAHWFCKEVIGMQVLVEEEKPQRVRGQGGIPCQHSLQVEPSADHRRAK